MCLQAEFEQIAADVQKVKTRPTDQELLDLYGLFKQANVGDVNTGKIFLHNHMTRDSMSVANIYSKHFLLPVFSSQL